MQKTVLMKKLTCCVRLNRTKWDQEPIQWNSPLEKGKTLFDENNSSKYKKQRENFLFKIFGTGTVPKNDRSFSAKSLFYKPPI